MVTAEKQFDIQIHLPRDITEGFYERFSDFLYDGEDEIKRYASI